MTADLRRALIDQAASVATSLAVLAGFYVAAHPELRRALARAVRPELRRISGADRRAWLASPPAEFARRRRAELIAAEWAAAADEPVTGAPARGS